MVAPIPRERLRISPRSAVLSVAMFGATLGLLAVVAAAQRVIGWILVAATLAGLLHPLVSLLARRMPRALATAIVMLTMVGTVGTVVYRIVDDVQRETRRLQEAGPERARELERSERFGELARDIRLAERTERFLRRLPERLRGGTTAEAIQAAATRGVAFLATGVLTIFFLQHGPRLARAGLSQLHDRRRRERLAELGIAVYLRAFGYASASLVMSLAAGLAAYLAARMADVPGPSALGVWVGLWDLVPLAGAAVGALPIVALAAASSGERALVVALAFVAYQVVENVLVQRRVERATVKVGPFVTLAAGLVGLELSGVAGALLAVLAATMVVSGADELAREGEDAEGEERQEPAERAVG
ncbi:MAG TPA: AI-2E family transporter [Acidimicrobiales bacterium]|nr:AI-2E family transporter [Acidimicrobiales bacterium]